MALQKNLANGDVKKSIIYFAIPLIITNLFQALYNAVDMFFVGRYIGTGALSSVSVSGPIINIMILTISALSVGVSVVIGKYEGREEYKRVKQCANTAIGIYLILATILTVFGIFFAETMLNFVNTPESSMEQAIIYLQTMFAGSIFMCGYNLIVAFQRGVGDSKTPMRLIVIASICNVLLNYLLVKVLGIGVVGAAIATVSSQAISFLLGVAYFRINKHIISFRIKEIKIYAEYFEELIKIGLPNMVQALISNIAFITFTGLANGFGMAASAAFGIGMKIDTFAWLPSDAIGCSVAAFTSQNIGALKPKRAVQGFKEAGKIALCLSFLTAATVFIFARQFIEIFNSDTEVIAYGVEYLQTTCFVYIISALIHPCIGFIRGTGNSIKTIFNVIISQYIFRIPVAYYLANHIGFSALPYSTIGGTFLSAVFYLSYIRSRKWETSSGYLSMTKITNEKAACIS